MIEIVPDTVGTAFLYFHSPRSSGDDLAPFVDRLRAELPNTYFWAGDGCIDGAGDPFMGQAVSSGAGPQRFWFVFPMHGMGQEDFASTVEPMGAVLVTCGGYINMLVDQVKARFQLAASRVVLCGHQHGACAALAAAMMRRSDPYGLTLLLDPWPWEAYYLQHEQTLPPTRVVCIDNLWAREREKQRGTDKELYKVFQDYGINAEGVTLSEGEGKPDEHMFREVIRQLKATEELHKK